MAVAALAAVAVPVAGAWTMEGGDPAHVAGFGPGGHVHDPVWSAVLRSPAQEISVADDALFAVSGGTVYRMTIAGEVTWENPGQGARAEVVVGGDLLFTMSSDGVEALDADTGNLEWSGVWPTTTLNSPAVWEENVLVPFDGGVVRLAQDDGELLDSWLSVQPTVSGGLVVRDDLVLHSFQWKQVGGGCVIALNLPALDEHWRYCDAAYGFRHPPTRTSSGWAVPNSKGDLVLLDDGGLKVWQVTPVEANGFVSTANAAILYTPPFLCQGTSNHVLACYDESTGEAEWSSEMRAGIQARVVATGGYLFAGTLEGDGSMELRSVQVGNWTNTRLLTVPGSALAMTAVDGKLLVMTQTDLSLLTAYNITVPPGAAPPGDNNTPVNQGPIPNEPNVEQRDGSRRRGIGGPGAPLFVLGLILAGAASRPRA